MATVLAPSTGEEIRDLLVHLLAGVTHASEATWRKRIGTIERYPTWKYVRFSWGVAPNAQGADLEAVKKAVEIVRAEHPYITDRLPNGIDRLAR
ncbi:hypothetical protein F1C10_14560 [Sphingomonas sp. NBWT7]|uniref:hypothetical protein n=1 Tax=Sphingomonas sp. NBWT7 TaxID=2596913 RepID=UPI0016274981|nr:hypothetical protein [Sphingomonas sp. NBWT7]QNE33019.1 hypothetical protein F1C10_14560 [Sphingomonas sp. NBWT7]